MNLPNALTVGRIAITPLIAILPFWASASARLVAFVLFLIAAISDYADGVLARSRQQETNLGRLLDPLADKLLLVGTLIPMWVLMRPMRSALDASGGTDLRGGAGSFLLTFHTPWGEIGLPLWILVIVLGREVFMTVFRQFAARRGVVISAIGPAKWKTALQLVWQGTAYFWFWLVTLAAGRAWEGTAWSAMAHFVGISGTLTMAVAVLLTVYSLALYMNRYARVFA